MSRFKSGGGNYHPQVDVDERGNQLVHIDRPLDAFDRVRVAEPYTIFDSKQIFDNQPLFWDDQQVSGGSTTSTFSSAFARSRLLVAGTTAGVRTRQTFMRFSYQPGKSQQILMTGVLDASGGGAGITRRIGLFDDDNGLFIEDAEGTINVVRRTNVTGSPVDNAVAQASWDDPMDGTGRSGITLDFTKVQIFVFDYEWLGTGQIRYSVIIDGEVIDMHAIDSANTLTEVHMSTPNLPLRYEIENDGTGVQSELDHICSTVISEGGQEPTGVIRAHSTAPTGVTASTADTIYAMIGIRLKSTHHGASVDLERFSIMNEGTQDFEWALRLNPTVAGPPTFVNVTNSAVQTYSGATANTVTGGTLITGGVVKSGKDSGELDVELKNALRLGVAIDGTTEDELVFTVQPLANAASPIQAVLTWRETP